MKAALAALALAALALAAAALAGPCPRGGEGGGACAAEQTPPRGPEVRETRHGRLMFNAADVPVGVALETDGEWEYHVVELLTALLEPGDLAVDVGAHIGTMTVPLARAVGTNGEVVAFEVQPSVFHMLCGNLALNAVTNAVPVLCGVGDGRVEEVVLELANDAFSTSAATAVQSLVEALGDASSRRASGPARKVALRMTSIDKYLGWDRDAQPSCAVGSRDTEFKTGTGRCPALVKIDVEGLEQDVLRGMDRTIRACGPLLFLENNHPRSLHSRQLLNTVWALDHGYRCFWVAGFLFPQVSPYASLSLNMICGPQSGGLAARLEQVARAEGLERISDPATDAICAHLPTLVCPMPMPKGSEMDLQAQVAIAKARELGPSSECTMETDVDFHGADLLFGEIEANSFGACCALCRAHELCNALAYVDQKQTCYLKIRVLERGHAVGVMAGTPL